VKLNFTATAPDQLWVADFTYCSTWSGVVYVAFVVDVYSRRIVGWKARSMFATLVVDALNMAAWTRRGVDLDGLVCHHDAGANTRRSHTRTASMTSVRSLRSAPSATALITRWPSR
jgi:putative transposase